jgi:hypothetical protein
VAALLLMSQSANNGKRRFKQQTKIAVVPSEITKLDTEKNQCIRQKKREHRT